MSEDKYRAALDAAAKQLSYRALSAKMLRDKLVAKGHDEEAADYALAWLTERSLLSDEVYAESVVRGYTRKGYGAARIRQELTRRGIDRDTAEAAMQSFSPDEAQMLVLLEKRLRGDVSDRKAVEKAVAALQRRGFAWSDIKRALEVYGSSLPDEEYAKPIISFEMMGFCYYFASSARNASISVSSFMVMRCILYKVCGRPCTMRFTPGWVVNVSSMP